jgi:signal transduction histidine kinase
LFAGSYAWRRAPSYEFRLNTADPWTPLDTGSLLRFPRLHEGKYHLQVRIAGQRTIPGAPLNFEFEVLPPWPRTWPAYALYAVSVLLAVGGVARWSSHLARRRNRVLEHLVRDRTAQLESTMQKLNEETRISATLAERDRLAGEIHDSVQQGLSGAILQLDTTLKLSALADDLRSRLDVVRNMISYARQEVQHAVWDMNSPLLEGNDLGAALRKLNTLTASSTVVPTVEVTGIAVPLPRSITHHLLRVAQEATTNAVRHARADRISIELDYEAEAVSLTVSDNGIGFNPDDALNKHGHFGLRGLRARVNKLPGKLTIRSARGQGTSIRVDVPLTTPNPVPRHAEARSP